MPFETRMLCIVKVLMLKQYCPSPDLDNAKLLNLSPSIVFTVDPKTVKLIGILFTKQFGSNNKHFVLKFGNLNNEYF